MDRHRNPVYGMTPTMFVSQLIGALPPTWDELALHLKNLDPYQLCFEEIHERVRAFELNIRAREMGSAIRAQGGHKGTPKPKGEGKLCGYCGRGVHPKAKYNRKLRDDFVKHHLN